MSDEPKGRLVRFTCEEHGEIWSAAVWCSHDIEAEVRTVAEAHRKPYGAACAAVLNVELLDAETMQPADPTQRRWIA